MISNLSKPQMPFISDPVNSTDRVVLTTGLAVPRVLFPVRQRSITSGKGTYRIKVRPVQYY